jgi:hypothetical protein
VSTEAEREVARLEAFLRAILDHGTTMWSSSSCGHGPGAATMTTSAHAEVVQHLAMAALRGETLEEAADSYAYMWPGTRRLDEAPGRSGRAGPDGRPR